MPIDFTRIRRQILTKKLYMNFIDSHYYWYDKTIDYTYTLLASIVPILSAIGIGEDSPRSTTSVALAISTIIAIASRFKATLQQYGTYRSVAKQQYLRYAALLRSIEPDQIKDDPIVVHYSACKEFSNLDFTDPKVPISCLEAFVQYCRKEQIPYETEADAVRKISTDINFAIDVDIEQTKKRLAESIATGV